ncbi:hypothetical protein RRG08_017728 [Elysia crispata]|uniref:Uncharacterized protein n=1 Tax=Elysia crispata TaxID=231223 RepID=A0AAE0XRC1_9GAST|nr:hypothetical protein RRG08_017728 [Elysia crispata]
MCHKGCSSGVLINRSPLSGQCMCWRCTAGRRRAYVMVRAIVRTIDEPGTRRFRPRGFNKLCSVQVTNSLLIILSLASKIPCPWLGRLENGTFLTALNSAFLSLLLVLLGTVKNVSVIKLSSHPGGEFTCCVCSQPLSPLHCYLYRRTVKNVSTIRDISTSHPSNESTAAAESEELLMQ